MKVLYLFTRSRKGEIAQIKKGELHDNSFYGMLRLPKFGIEADYLDPDEIVPVALSNFLKKILTAYAWHAPFYFRFLRYDIVFTWTAFGTQLLHTLYPFKKPRWVMYDFSIIGLLGNGRTWKQRLLAWIVSRAAGIITIGVPEKDVLERRFPHLRGRIEFIPLGVDTDFFAPRAAGEVRQVFAPGLDPCRDYKTLFAAGEQLGIPLVVSKSRTIEDHGAPPYVRAEFFSPASIMDEYARSAVIVICLDISNGINDAAGCTTLVEAMSLGKAIIASRTPTMESYITDGVNGILVPQRDPQALKEAIERVMNDEALRRHLGEAARTYALEHCRADVAAEKLAAFFKKISEPKTVA